MSLSIKYKYSDLSIWFTTVAACIICFFYTWHGDTTPDFMGGDARYYYIYLQSTFIDHQLIDFGWQDPANGIVLSHHPIGVAVLLLPFFLLAWLSAHLFHFPVDGVSAPFQVSVSVAAIFYAVVGLVYLKKLFRLNRVPDKISALVIALIFFGTNLFHYALNESGMSHVYSFSLISVFLYHCANLVNNGSDKSFLYAAAIYGLILLVRPNNGLVLFTLPFWFRSANACLSFFKDLFKRKVFYQAVLLVLAIALIQPLTWLWKEDVLFVNRYASYGFYWLRPHFLEMLFGFEAGFFIYTPLCLLFLFGLISVFKENKFMAAAMGLFILSLFYVFSAYSAYTYYDGLGIRVLVDYYSLFAFLGAKLFAQALQYKFMSAGIASLAVALLSINLVYCYQGERGILARSGMNFNKWKYVFLRTGKQYENCLGGAGDLPPFSKIPPTPVFQKQMTSDLPFDFSEKDYGPSVSLDSLGFNSKRIGLRLKLRRTEKYINASKDVMVCAMLKDRSGAEKKGYLQFRLNETPAVACCTAADYDYNATMEASFDPSDRLSIYLWNINKQPFLLEKFSVEVYNYNYQLN